MSRNRPQTVGPLLPETPFLFASTVHGLEDLAADELAGLGYRVRSIRKRQVLLAAQPSAASPAATPSAPPTATPRTADDLLVQVAETADPGPTKADLARLALDADLAPVEADFATGEPVLTVSASISGHRTYNRHDLEAVIGAHLAERLHARFASRAGGAKPRSAPPNGAPSSDRMGSSSATGAAAHPCTAAPGRPRRSPAPCTRPSPPRWPASHASNRA